jgi:hypothetical protein
MDLFRSQPSLCSLFLSLLEEWGAATLDWSLLRDEIFVDRFLRRLVANPQVDDACVFQACAQLLQPSAAGLLVAPLLVRGGHFERSEMDSFVEFAVAGKARSWDPLSWPELLTVLEEVAFTRPQEPARFLACMLGNGWVPVLLQGRFTQRVWETCRLRKAEKGLFFAWLGGHSAWPELPAPAGWQAPTLRVAQRLRCSATPFSDRRRGISATSKEAAV